MLKRDLRLEFTSSSFDPVEALKADHVDLPYPKVKMYNNLSEYSSYTFSGRGGRGGGRDRYERDRVPSRYRSPSPSGGGRYRSPSPRYGRSSPSRSGRYRSPSPTRRYRSPSPRYRTSPGRYRSPSPGPSYGRHGGGRDRRRESPSRHDKYKDKHGDKPSFKRDRGGDDDDERRKLTIEDNRDVLERMEKSFEKGPLEVLYRCVKENTKVKVWTRNFKEVRGICTGYVVAFDKHWNMVMKDVDEVYLKPRKGKTPFLRELKPEDKDLIPEMQPKVPKVKNVQKDASEANKDAGEVVKGSEDASEAPMELEVESATEEKSTEDKPDDDQSKQDEAAEGQSAPSGTESAVESQTSEQKPADAEKKKKKKKKRKNKGPEMCKRHVGQLFVRGDNVVMVAVLAPAS